MIDHYNYYGNRLCFLYACINTTSQLPSVTTAIVNTHCWTHLPADTSVITIWSLLYSNETLLTVHFFIVSVSLQLSRYAPPLPTQLPYPEWVKLHCNCSSDCPSIAVITSLCILSHSLVEYTYRVITGKQFM